MCGFAGFLDLRGRQSADRDVLVRMTEKLGHRGPDSEGYFIEGGIGLGCKRLEIIDLATGDQPLFNEDGRMVLVCNGEIFNYKDLRRELLAKNHIFRTQTDIEVLLHLYEEHGIGCLSRINGQFAFALYDKLENRIFLARDQFGIAPLHYTVSNGVLIFGSEIKAILEFPGVTRQVNLQGLDQTLSFPGLISPTTMFRDIYSLSAGTYLEVAVGGEVRTVEYWDLDYPMVNENGDHRPEEYYVDRLEELFSRSVSYRLQADVPVGFYLSGGMDSSMIAAVARQASGDRQFYSFSIVFGDKEISEGAYQHLMAERARTQHQELFFDWKEIAERLVDMVYHCECPVKESFNTCAMALSGAAREANVKVVLAGQGADELFAGYMGYRFDQSGVRRGSGDSMEALLEEEVRESLWGDRNLFYEKNQYALRETKREFYSADVVAHLPHFDSTEFPLVNKERLSGRHPLHQRSYLDFKLRLQEHLLSEHGDRMVMANSVEGRYPFLDIDLVNFVTCIPVDLKLKGMIEKYILKRIARRHIPAEICDREKFGFRAPGTPFLLRQRNEWIEDMLSVESVRRRGVFSPQMTEHLRGRYSHPGFKLNPHIDTDMLMVVLTFNILCDLFDLPPLT